MGQGMAKGTNAEGMYKWSYIFMVRSDEWCPSNVSTGTHLVLIYINDLDNGIKNWILKFDDDTKIFSAVNNDSDRRLLPKDLDNFLMWPEDWQMMFSVSTCKVMHLGHKNHGYSYYMDMKQLDTTEEEKDLGIMITKDLTVSQQCKQAYAKDAGCY